MAKLQILDINGNKLKEMNSAIFDGNIREDIIQKIIEVEKESQPYAPFYKAGLQTSASGNVKHNRHVWKTDRGKGLSRYPKKRMSDKGERFTWIAAVIPGVRKGRRAHPPRVLKRAELKINKKEQKLGFLSALALISSLEKMKTKYQSIREKEIKIKLPIVVDTKLLSLKSGEFFQAVRKIIGEDLFNIALKESQVRAGRGKMRGRRYKSNAGLLLVLGNKEEKKISGIDVIKVKDIKIADMASNGARLVLFTEESIKDFENKLK